MLMKELVWERKKSMAQHNTVLNATSSSSYMTHMSGAVVRPIHIAIAMRDVTVVVPM